MEILALWNNITKYMQIEVKSNRLNVTSHNYQYQKDEEPLNKAILQERSDDSYHRPKPFRNKKKKKKALPRNQRRRPKKNSLGNILVPPTSQERNPEERKKQGAGFACERNKS